MVKYVPTYTKGIHFEKKRSVKNSSNDAYVKFLFCFFLIFFKKAFVVGTNLNCIDMWMQFKWVPTTYAYI